MSGRWVRQETGTPAWQPGRESRVPVAGVPSRIGRRRQAVSTAFWLLVLTVLGTPSWAQWAQDTGLLLTGTVVTMTAGGDVLPNTRLWIRREKIEALLRPGDPLPPEAAQAVPVATDGYIFPGLIDAHSHTAYNMLPLWTVPKRYTTRYQWPSHKTYKTDINTPKKLLTEPKYLGLNAEVGKYAEIKALVGGTTALQGSASDNAYIDYLVRNVEFKNFEKDRIGQRGLPIDPRFLQTIATEGAKIKTLDAWLYHLAEGTDPQLREEFKQVKDLGLLGRWLVAIHGTALTAADFQEMAQAGAKLVWSPLSNLLLYGKTTDVAAAKRAGVLIALGSDWSPSGSKNLLGELKVADLYNREVLSTLFTDRELVELVTVNPATALGWAEQVGTIAPGRYADLVVVDRRQPDPYRSLITATEQHVQLVLIGGEPYYGDEDLLAALKTYSTGPDYERLHVIATRRKAIDVTRAGIPKGKETAQEILALVAKALQMPEAEVKAAIPAARDLSAPAWQQWLKQTFPGGVKRIEADPLYTGEDPRFFQGIEGNMNVPAFLRQLQPYYAGPS